VELNDQKRPGALPALQQSEVARTGTKEEDVPVKESKALTLYRNKWVGKTVEYGGNSGIVVGVCDDGYRCDYDNRRRAKPTFELIVKIPVVTADFYFLEELVTVIEL